MSTGFGLVARDHKSNMMVVASHMENTRYDPTVAKALGLRWSLFTIRDMDMEDVIIETDSLLVYKAMTTDRCKPAIEPIIQDCKQLSNMFSSISFSHVNRKANNAAHILASLANDFPSNVWWENPPRAVAEAIFVDAFSTH